MEESERKDDKNTLKHRNKLLTSTALAIALAGALAIGFPAKLDSAFAQNIRGSATGPTTAPG
jgi:hypothetical protein